LNPIDALAVLVIALVPFNLAVAIYLSALNRRRPGIPTLESRAFTQIVLTACATVGGFFGLSVLLGLQVWPNVVTVLLAVLGIGISLPAANWTIVYLRGGLR
jgi:hypothetical protein